MARAAQIDIDIDIGGGSDPGRVRENNEDYYSIPSDLERRKSKKILCIVADGMGGHVRGEMASRIATEVIRSSYYVLSECSGTESAQALRSALLRADREIWQQSETEGSYGMGTTAVVLLLQREKALVANVGDSRAYLVRNGKLKRITVDHTLAQERGMSSEEARSAGISSVLTRAVGRGIKEEDIDVFSTSVRERDIFLLCSDGLTGHVDDAFILEILQQPKDSRTLCQQLIERANALGGRDNITAVVVKVGGKRPRSQGTGKSTKYASLIGGIAVVSFVAGFASHWLLENDAEKLERGWRKLKGSVSVDIEGSDVSERGMVGQGVDTGGQGEEVELNREKSGRISASSVVEQKSAKESQMESGSDTLTGEMPRLRGQDSIERSGSTSGDVTKEQARTRSGVEGRRKAGDEVEMPKVEARTDSSMTSTSVDSGLVEQGKVKVKRDSSSEVHKEVMP